MATLGLAAHGLSPVVVNRGWFLVAVLWLPVALASLLQNTGCSARASGVVAHGLSCPMACRSSWAKDQSCVPCIGRRILNHWTTREVLGQIFRSGIASQRINTHITLLEVVKPPPPELCPFAFRPTASGEPVSPPLTKWQVVKL